jgi:exodeoxyribonuclease VII small subunit
MTKTGPFEQSITELETIVTRLEKGDLDLEEALQQFEKGVHLARTCQSTLRQAEQRIEALSADLNKPDEATNA